MTDTHYRVEVVPRAGRDLESLPPKMATACVSFIFSTLAEDPYRVSKPLLRELTGTRSARRGAYRIIFRIDDRTRLVEILHIAHRAHVYRS